MSNAISRAARERMARTGEPYTLARRMVIEEREKAQGAVAGEAGTPFGPEAVGAMAGFLRAIMQPPPGIHVHKPPETEEEMAADPFLPSLTITREGE